MAGMTIKELIEKLSKFDDNAEVFIYTRDRIHQIEEVAEALQDDPVGSAIIYIDD